MLIVVFLLLTVLIFMQFGGRLAASQALLWWTTFFFLGIATAFPEYLRPLATLVGVELVSNLVLGGMIMLLVFQIIEQSARSTVTQRQLRSAIANAAAHRFVERRLTRSMPDSDTRKPGPGTLVVLPCFNEAEALPGVISQMKDLCDKVADGFRIDYCFVNDGSTDKTAKILQELCPSNYASHSVNIGVAGVLLTGFEIARTCDFDFVIQCDGDGQHPIYKIPDLIRHASETGADLLIGSRHAPPHDNSGDPVAKDHSSTPARFLGAQVLKMTMALFGNDTAVSDPTSGFRVFSAKAITALQNNMPDEYPEPEAVVLTKLAGLKVGEVRVVMLPRTTGVSSLAGLKSVAYMIKVASALLGLRLRSLF